MVRIVACLLYNYLKNLNNTRTKRKVFTLREAKHETMAKRAGEGEEPGRVTELAVASSEAGLVRT